MLLDIPKARGKLARDQEKGGCWTYKISPFAGIALIWAILA
jgi:hypothetical protein